MEYARADMDSISPIDGFLAGRLSEDELLAEVERVIAEGSEADRTLLLSDWRTKSGRIIASGTRRKLDVRVQPLTWFTEHPENTEKASKPKRPLQRGDVLANRFVIDAVIGSGGMGTVFKARDLRREEAQDRQPYVAVKTLNADVLQRDDSLKILQREARKAQSLSHPNIVRIYDFDRDASTLFITMELLEGTSLNEVIQTNGLSGSTLASFLPILTQVVSALQFAHAEGIVHSDLKPANIIILPNGRVKIIDFGIARAIPILNQQTIDHTTFDLHALGAMTPAYASPEMIEGQDADPRDDVFALTCVIYEFLTGRHPFGRAPASIARAGNFSPQEPENISPSQWNALRAGLHFDRLRRTPSVEQLLADLVAQVHLLLSRRTKFVLGASIVSVVVGLGIYSIRNIDLSNVDWLSALESSGRPQPSANQMTGITGPSDQAVMQAQSARNPAHEAAKDAVQKLAQAAEDAVQKLAQQKAAEETAQRLTQQKAAEDAAQRLAQQKAAEDAAQKLAQQKAAEDAAQKLAQQKAAEDAAQQLAQQKAAEDAAQKLAQQRAAEDAAQKLAQQKAAEDAAQKLAQPKLEQIGPSQIAEAQRLLTSLGLNTGSADGKAGARTQEMVRAYQLTIGAPLTGELTLMLLDSLRRVTPSTAMRAKSLFTLAAEARHAERLGDAIRLYESGLKLSPTSTDGLLALGDLHRDQKDYNAARQVYEAVERSGGLVADIAHDRLVALPDQHEALATRGTNDTVSPGSNRGVSGEQQVTLAGRGGPLGASTSSVQTTPEIVRIQPNGDSGRPMNENSGSYDGTYQGAKTAGFNSPICDRSPVSTWKVMNRHITINYGKGELSANIEPNGSFETSKYWGGGSSRLTRLTGRVAGRTLSAEIDDPYCKYSFLLNKTE
jgi:serine/threonine protein kinase/peptidoglycan hydrolase-like protein with peptidoglycan-binding domain